MKTIIKQSADGIALIRDNKLDTTQGKVFINNHEITDIDTFFKVAKENTRLLKQVKKQKEVIDKAVLELANIDGGLSNSQLSDRICNLIDILKEVSE